MDWTPPESPLELDASQRTALLDQITATVGFVLECVGPTATVVTNWKVEAKRSGMTFFEDHTLLEAKRSRSSPERFCCVEHTTASVEDVLQLFVATDNAALQRHARVMHSKLVETRLLTVLHAPSESKPWASTYVQYTRVRSSPWRRDRDLCAVVATDCLRLRDGSTLGYCLWDSVDLDSLCPDLLDSQGVWRTRMRRSGYVLHNSGRPNAKTKNSVPLRPGPDGRVLGLAAKPATKLALDPPRQRLAARQLVRIVSRTRPDRWQSGTHLCALSAAHLRRDPLCKSRRLVGASAREVLL
ncbi:hypothetical protein PINS_up006529 [Pythium insidiosum]|nr:hypothetical protein PINS_up006529 [Pythium insidiosum]